ncbi:high intensity light-inducible lhc-like protein [Monoraphidium neglectum]|uniref:High intensity light-inducible lhc-like protein n=1 Tax=Monoraphidium neglectum TaxID=145388 RepID=A0A0D2M9K2_9CHLO|nr:high intensity light-inducible lhc-like protein [Monoraphidium neglectum]KIY99994.1 high intensity light-inducible lhc-like protein [Monoraphidium neglectum]|eukprot:XP_013899014.1 high intensity light-inducible lhc-like protein [Monoraphidium neglectum]
MVVRASSTSKSGVAQFADSIGLPTGEGIFGFRPFAEVWVGRLAMMGFVTSIVEEATTGQGTLRQIGLEPSPGLLAGLLGVLGVALVAGTASTAVKLAQKKMTAKDIARYKNFLGLNNGNDFIEAANAMKRKGDFTTPGNDLAAIAAAKAAGSPADAFLSTSEVAEGSAAAAEMKAADSGVLTLTKEQEAAQVNAALAEMKAGKTAGPAVSLAAKADILEEAQFSGSFEKQYARDVELTNGRAAMLGFLAAVLVEAATDKGIIMQIIMWLKFSGFLGAASGF